MLTAALQTYQLQATIHTFDNTAADASLGQSQPSMLQSLPVSYLQQSFVKPLPDSHSVLQVHLDSLVVILFFQA